jgi:NB-ARC domain/WD domain, G-beta repeat
VRGVAVRHGHLGLILGVLVSGLLGLLVQFAGLPVWVALPLAVVQVGVSLWLEVRGARRRRVARLTGVPAPARLVARPVQVDRVVGLLVGKRRGTVAITATTGLIGAGGFGKTTLATMVRDDRRIRRHFSESVEITLGQAVRGEALTSKINDVIEALESRRPGYTDAETAGAHLVGLLESGRGRRLLVLDDVWFRDQLDPFRGDGRRCAVLVTTRVPHVLPDEAGRVEVAEMSPDQARQMITLVAAGLPSTIVNEIVAATGGWPLLLSLIAARLRITAEAQGDIVAAARLSLDLLRADGPTAFDLTHAEDRSRAVSLTLRPSLDLLPADGERRFAELGIFPEDTPIPVAVISQLWAATTGAATTARALCQQLNSLSLARYRPDTDTVEVHDVIRAYQRATLGANLPGTQATFVDQVGAGLPLVSPPTTDTGEPGPAWWLMPDGNDYLWTHLADHIVQAQRPGEVDRVIADLRWVGARLLRSGPEAPLRDLGLLPTPRAASLHRAVSRCAHLLAPTTPSRALLDVLASRLADDPTWGNDVEQWASTLPQPRLANRWPLPDLPEPGLRRLLTGHTGSVWSVAISADGTWLATAGGDETVRIWDAATGEHRAILTGHTSWVRSVAISADGTWLATVGNDETVRIWDAATGMCEALMRVDGILLAVAWAPNRRTVALTGSRGVYLFTFLTATAVPPSPRTTREPIPARTQQ